MEFVDKLFDILKEETEGLDAIYEDFICRVVGRRGLQCLIENKLIETCGIINGRRLYTLCDWKE